MCLCFSSASYIHVCVCVCACSETGSLQPVLVYSRFKEEQSGLEPTTGAQYICLELQQHHMTPAQLSTSAHQWPVFFTPKSSTKTCF